MSIESIELTPVKSSNISAIGYNGGTLAVRFSSGMIYHYSDVPASVYEEFKKAESIGRFFSTNVRNKFKGTAVPAKK